MPNVKSSIPYPSRRDNERRRDQANEQIEKFYKIFKDMSFEISFTDALILMPKFASTLKALIGNKEKLRMDECLALVDIDASINLMPLSVWEALSLPELTPTCMTLKLANHSVSKPIGIAKYVSFKVGVFHFPSDFVVVDFEPDRRVLISQEVFLKDSEPLPPLPNHEQYMPSYKKELKVNDEAVTFNLNQTTRYSSTYDDLSVNRIDIIDVAREEYAQEILGFSNNSSGGNPTLTSEPILFDSSPSLTPFEGSDFILEEIKAYLKDESISPEIDHADCNPEGDICLIENLLNNDPFQLPPMNLKQGE
nr:reverse transcriptase domain-containing protein [Tanacetum cinerariifolium]